MLTGFLMVFGLVVKPVRIAFFWVWFNGVLVYTGIPNFPTCLTELTSFLINLPMSSSCAPLDTARYSSESSSSQNAPAREVPWHQMAVVGGESKAWHPLIIQLELGQDLLLHINYILACEWGNNHATKPASLGYQLGTMVLTTIWQCFMIVS